VQALTYNICMNNTDVSHLHTNTNHTSCAAVSKLLFHQQRARLRCL
jgi:hypothetical protein